jgi:hypothetical protein
MIGMSQATVPFSLGPNLSRKGRKQVQSFFALWRLLNRAEAPQAELKTSRQRALIFGKQHGGWFLQWPLILPHQPA